MHILLIKVWSWAAIFYCLCLLFVLISMVWKKAVSFVSEPSCPEVELMQTVLTNVNMWNKENNKKVFVFNSGIPQLNNKSVLELVMKYATVFYYTWMCILYTLITCHMNEGMQFYPMMGLCYYLICCGKISECFSRCRQNLIIFPAFRKSILKSGHN